MTSDEPGSPHRTAHDSPKTHDSPGTCDSLGTHDALEAHDPDEWLDDPDDLPWFGDDLDDDLVPPLETRVLENGGDALDAMLRLVGSERSGPAAIWFLVLDADDRLLPIVLPISDVPTIPDRVVVSHLAHVLASVLENDAPGGSVVIGYVRRGGGDRGAFEGAWSSTLRDQLGQEEVRVRSEVAIGRDRARLLPPGW